MQGDKLAVTTVEPVAGSVKAPEVESGQTLSHYQLVHRLGSGGMGVVWMARDTRLGRNVALKFLPEEFVHERRFLARFQREARTASALNHPHICTIHDMDEHLGQPFLVMELIEGRTLRELAREGISVATLRQLGSQVAKALAAAHGAGIVHRDVKPENIMVRADGYVKVVDFGLARETAAIGASGGAVSDPGTIVGTVRYMSPEQARGESVDSATDVFSLGIVFYELASGRHPFEADTHIGILHGIQTHAPLPPSRVNPEVSPALDGLILKMLEKDPRLRPGAVEVEEALAASPGGRTQAAIPAPRSPRRVTVGRDRELETLRTAFAAVEQSRGSILALAGEAGIGKTTLVEDLLASLMEEGRPCMSAQGRCSERLAGTEAYLPFLEALEGLLHGVKREWVAREMKLLAPTWYIRIAPLAQDTSSIAQVLAEAQIASQERMKRELVAFLEELGRNQPVLLFLDDVHWADISTADLLSYLGSRCASMRLLMVVTYRPSDLLLSKHPFLAVKQEMQGRGVCQEINLDFLTHQDIERYLTVAFPQHRFPAALADVIHRRTEGSPLFMVDLLRYLRDQRVIAEEQGGWALLRPLSEIEQDLPESVRSMIQRKMDRLNEDERHLLSAASVQGTEFAAVVAARVLGLDAADVEDKLQVIERSHALVRRMGEQEFADGTLTLRFRFVHALYQNALYGALAPSRKAAWSAAVAQALLDCYRERSPTIAAELALLFEGARDFPRAADHFLQAAINAATVYANREAVDLARRAAANADKLRGDARASRLLAAAVKQAEYHHNLSQFDEALAAFDVAEKAATELQRPAAQIDALCGQAMMLFKLRRLSEVQQQAERARELARASSSDVGVASAELVLACERVCVGDLTSADQHFDRAIPVLLKEGPPAQVLEAINTRASLHTWRLEYAEAERSLDWALAKARELGVYSPIIENHFFRGMVFGNRGRLGEALSQLQEGMRLAELHGDRYWLSRLPNTLGWIHGELQDREQALRLNQEGARMGHELGFAEGEANSHVNLARDYLALGEFARCLDHLRQAEGLFQQDVWYRWRYNLRLQAEFASYWIARGDLKQAAVHAASSLRQAETARARKHMAWARKLQGDIATLEERMADAGEEYQAALRMLEHHPCPTIEWKILQAAAARAQRISDDLAQRALSGRQALLLQGLADSVADGALRETLLGSQGIRELKI
jgi:tetratricopeptide (TPR) repeat protein